MNHPSLLEFPHQMSSVNEFSHDDGDNYNDEEMLDGTQEEGKLFLLVVPVIHLLYLNYCVRNR